MSNEGGERIRRATRGRKLVTFEDAVTISDSRPHGHVSAVLTMARALEFESLIDRSASRQRRLATALVVHRLLADDSAFATSQPLEHSTLCDELNADQPDTEDVYAAIDYLLERQDAIEKRLASRQRRDATLVVYDVSSSYLEERIYPLAMRGYSGDELRGSLRIVYGLLCDRVGRPVAVEVFEGNTPDDRGVQAQIEKLKGRFELSRIVFVSDRAKLTTTNLCALRETQIDWITALKAAQVKALSVAGALPLSLFHERNLAEIVHGDYPGERLIACRNPVLAKERARKREALLRATEAKLQPIQDRVGGGTLRGKAEIGLAVGAMYDTYVMSKHLEFDIDDERFVFPRKESQIAEEASLDGMYVLRTNVDAEHFSASDVVRSYKQLAKVERSFRSMKSDDLALPPVHYRLEERVRAHVFLCMLAYFLEWHLRRAWEPLLHMDEDPKLAGDPVTQAIRSAKTVGKARLRRTKFGESAYSFRTLLEHLALQMRVTMKLAGAESCYKIARPTPLQARALEYAKTAPDL